MTEIRCDICNVLLGQSDEECFITCPSCIRLRGHLFSFLRGGFVSHFYSQMEWAGEVLRAEKEIEVCIANIYAIARMIEKDIPVDNEKITLDMPADICNDTLDDGAKNVEIKPAIPSEVPRRKSKLGRYS